MRLRIQVDKTVEVGDPKSDGRPDTSTFWDFGAFHVEDSDAPTDDLTITLDAQLAQAETLYAVIAVWSSGDSFGWDDRYNAEIISVHPSEANADAARRIVEASAPRYGQPAPALPVDLPDGYQLSGYIPWGGHFDRLDYVTIVSDTINPTIRPS